MQLGLHPLSYRMDAAGFISTQLQRAAKKTQAGSARGSGLALAPQFPAHQADLSWDSRPPLCSGPAGSGIQTTLQLLSQNGQRPLGCHPPPPNKAASVNLRDDCPKASQEKSSQEGSRAERTDKPYRGKWNQQSELNSTRALQADPQAEVRKAPTTAGRGVWLEGGWRL